MPTEVQNRMKRIAKKSPNMARSEVRALAKKRAAKSDLVLRDGGKPGSMKRKIYRETGSKADLLTWRGMSDVQKGVVKGRVAQNRSKGRPAGATASLRRVGGPKPPSLSSAAKMLPVKPKSVKRAPLAGRFV